MWPCECGHDSTSKRNLFRHQSTCVARKFAIQNIELTQKNAYLEQRNSELVAENASLIAENIDLKKSRTNTTINVANHFNIVAYGQEPLPEFKDVLPILRSGENSVARYIELKHFSKPETSNMRIQNKRSRTMQIVEEDANKRLRWTEKDRKRMIEILVDSNIDELIKKHGAEKVLLWKQWYDSSGLGNDKYDKTEAWKQINNDVENMLMSQRDDNQI